MIIITRNQVESFLLLLPSIILSHIIPSFSSLLTTSFTILGLILLTSGNYKQQQLRFDRDDGILMGGCLLPTFFSSILATTTTTDSNLELYANLSSLAGASFLSFQIWRKTNPNATTPTPTPSLFAFVLGGLTLLFLTTSTTKQISVIGLFTAFYLSSSWIYYHSSRSSSLRAQMSMGEWNSFSIAFSICVSDYLSRYVLCSVPPSSYMQSHLAVSHAGLVGCFLGCGLVSYLGDGISSMKNNPLGKCVCIVSATVGCVELTLKRIHDTDPRLGTTNDILSMNNTPLFLQWLITFLRTSEDDDINLSSSFFSKLPRYTCLLYWVMILLFITPLSFHLVQNLPTIQTRRRNTTTTTTTNNSSVIVYRKFFHFIAILLFFPITTTHPQMMALSYTISIGLLLLLESIRHSIPIINTFFDALLDDKDAKDGGFVISHVGLIVGCAIPLWVWQYLVVLLPEDDDESSRFLLLPYAGIVVLGLGDAFGAIVGVLYGTHSFLNGKKSWEGVFAMFVGMIGFVYGINHFLGVVWEEGVSCSSISWKVLGFLSLMEGCTTQIDNFVLPIFGVIWILIEAIREQ